MKKIHILQYFLLFAISSFATGKDTSGNDMTLATKFGVVDGSKTVIGDIVKFANDYTDAATNAIVVSGGISAGTVTNIAMSAAVTNQGAVSYANATFAPLSMISSTDPTFTNAVLQTTTGIDTNFVSVIGQFKESWGDFPLNAGQTTATLASLLAALSAAIAWLKKNKRNNTDNTCHQTTSGFTLWRATLPTDHEWDDQPTFNTTVNKWIWGSMSEDVEGDSSDPDATSVTFSYTIEEEAKSFTATRTTAQPATADKTFTTQDYTDQKVGTFAAVGGVTPTVANGVADVSVLFTSANTSLVATIQAQGGGIKYDSETGRYYFTV